MQCESASHRVVVLGLGYTGTAIARRLASTGAVVVGTRRAPDGNVADDITTLAFDAAGPAIAAATHLVVTAAPGEAGCPVLARHGNSIAAARMLRWIGYLSTTGVYGDRDGGWVDETTPPAPGQPRSVRRLAAEEGWAALSDRVAVDVFRLGGIYGPGRTPFAALRAGQAKRVIKPGHRFGRIHRDDVALAVAAAALGDPPPGRRVFNLVDDEPAESAEVEAYAARLLGLPEPPAVPFEDAARGMSPMARSFWAENRRVANVATKAILGLAWRYPSYREGLAACLVEERADHAAEQGEIGRA